MYNSARPSQYGELVTTRQGRVALLILGMALVAPTLLLAGSKTVQHAETPQQVQKSAKQYNKQLKKDQKHQAKMAKKQQKQNKQRMQTTHSVTG
jgi:hypothetical protein